ETARRKNPGRNCEELRTQFPPAVGLGVSSWLFPPRSFLLAVSSSEQPVSMEQLISDVRSSLRSLLKHPAYTLAIAVALALGIAGVTIVFTFLDAVVLRPLPYPDAERLVRLNSPVP